MRRVLDSCERALLPTQDGLTATDVRSYIGARIGLFVGGSTAWKLRSLPEWAELSRAAGCWLHVARVNSRKRILLCSANGVTSIDGTSATRYASTLPLLDGAVRQLGLFHGGTR